MFVEIKEKSRLIETIPLKDISVENSTEYEYSKALAEVLKPYIQDRIGVLVTVFIEDSAPIHALQIIPKGDSVMVTENGVNTFPLRVKFKPSSEVLPEKYLVMVNAERNNNKFYRMVDCGNDTFEVYYGRIGERQGESHYSQHVEKPFSYPAYMYFIKLTEKLVKGYEDKTELHLSFGKMVGKKSVTDDLYDGIEEETIVNLLKNLIKFSKQTINQNYTIKAEDVTIEMVNAAKVEIEKLKECATVDDFNAVLLELMHILPRRIDGAKQYGVKSLLAKSESNFSSIIVREVNLLDVVEGQAKVNGAKISSIEDTTQAEKKNLLQALGLEIYLANEKQLEEVKKHLNDSLQPKLVRVYRVINKNTQERFNEYLETHKNGRKKCKVMQLWHGSGNENWLSILQHGLLLNPNAQITGKMFGRGIYFAPSAVKSWGYTSSYGSVWKHGNSNTAYMGLYATAYGKPYKVTSNSLFHNSFSESDFHALAPDCNCVHAERGNVLRNDEIVYYNENQTTINYLCEFAC